MGKLKKKYKVLIVLGSIALAILLFFAIINIIPPLEKR